MQQPNLHVLDLIQVLQDFLRDEVKTAFTRRKRDGALDPHEADGTVSGLLWRWRRFCAVLACALLGGGVASASIGSLSAQLARERAHTRTLSGQLSGLATLISGL